MVNSIRRPAFLAAAVWACTVLYAQVNSQIAGTIRDAAGLPVSGATVQINVWLPFIDAIRTFLRQLGSELTFKLPSFE
jgi:hypothetical protein